MDYDQPRNKRTSKARARYEARQAARSAMAAPRDWDSKPQTNGVPVRQRIRTQSPAPTNRVSSKASLLVLDALWYLTHRIPIARYTAGVIAFLIVFFLGSNILGVRVFPNVWALGVNLGGYTQTEGEAVLANAWASNSTIQLVDGDRTWKVSPLQLGINIDAADILEQARAIGLSGVPFGYEITPTINFDYGIAQAALLDLTEEANLSPLNAGFELSGDQLVSIPGRDGRALDVGLTMERLSLSVVQVARDRELELVMTPLPPESTDSSEFLQAAQEFVSRPFEIEGYDPFTNQHIAWSTSRDVLVTWLEAGSSGLTLREETFAPFIEAQNTTLNTEGNIRYLEPQETMEKLRQAINGLQNKVNVRIRYRPSTYEVVAGDTGFRIGRRTGLPFFLIQSANPGIDWNTLSPGDIINLPSRDVTIPMDPIPEKRIIVNLDDQTLVAYENGQEVFNWLISSGIDRAPTSPGIYQILSHADTALGSSSDLCGELGCGQWEMYWFMGIYEVVPGLMNGFHGAVLLPNGAYLGGGSVGAPYTYGCIMSLDSNAQLLYEWADMGTVVEIVSSEFEPLSDVARVGEINSLGTF